MLRNMQYFRVRIYLYIIERKKHTRLLSSANPCQQVAAATEIFIRSIEIIYQLQSLCGSYAKKSNRLIAAKRLTMGSLIMKSKCISIALLYQIYLTEPIIIQKKEDGYFL